MFKVLILQASHSLSDERTEWTCLEKVESSFPEGGGFPVADRKQTFTPEFRAEAVRLAQTTGGPAARSPPISASGSRRCGNWIDGRREREMDNPPADRQEDMAAELKRLRRENEVLRQEREILKRATAFFAKEGSR